MVGMISACPNKTPELLQRMPGAPSEISEWFDTLTDRAFDTVCVSAVTVMLREEQDESGFISATSIARCTRAVRDRYRQICILKGFSRTLCPKNDDPRTRLNEIQVRIARRVNQLVSSAVLAEMFQVDESTLRRARNGDSWRYIKQEQPPLQLSPAFHAA